MRAVQAGEVTVCVADDGDGPPVLLLHGNPDRHTMWSGVLSLAEDRGLSMRAIRPDMPGFGASPEPPPRFDYRAASTTPMWDALLDHLAVNEPLVAVLHDFGGPWFLPWVARQPDRVRGLVVCNAPMFPELRWHTWARVWQTPWLGELASAASPKALFRAEMRRGSKGLAVAYCDAAHAAATPKMRRSVLRTYRSHAHPAEVWAEEWPLLLAAIEGIPTRVVWGAKDPYLKPAFAERFGAPVTLVPGAGHWCPVEAPGAVVDALEAVLTA